MKAKIELAQKIGNEVCEDCSPDADCDENQEECPRIANAVAMIDEYLVANAVAVIGEYIRTQKAR